MHNTSLYDWVDYNKINIPVIIALNKYFVFAGLGCTTVTSPDAAALAAAQILGLNDHVIWSKLRAKQLNTWRGLKEADQKTRDDK